MICEVLRIFMHETIKDGDQCKVTDGTHKGKSGTVRDINTSKTGHVTITVVQENGDRFKTLAKNVTVTGI
jgi:ribosomal protein S4E